MQNLSPRYVKLEESLRLGVISGWYSTKVSGTFVSGPHETEADCLRRIAEIIRRLQRQQSNVMPQQMPRGRRTDGVGLVR